jgi:hypothetical protein
MQELELETAELLPNRETLCCNPCWEPCGGGISICVSIQVCL